MSLVVAPIVMIGGLKVKKKKKSIIYVAATYCCSNKNVPWCSTRADATAVTGRYQKPMTLIIAETFITAT